MEALKKIEKKEYQSRADREKGKYIHFECEKCDLKDRMLKNKSIWIGWCKNCGTILIWNYQITKRMRIMSRDNYFNDYADV